MKRSGFGCVGVLALLISTVHGAQIVPVAVSPGSERGVALVGPDLSDLQLDGGGLGDGLQGGCLPGLRCSTPLL